MNNLFFEIYLHQYLIAKEDYQYLMQYSRVQRLNSKSVIYKLGKFHIVGLDRFVTSVH